ncbi:MAG: diguanylate cyclase domain-containing protein [Caldicoprobacterales bacterium]
MDLTGVVLVNTYSILLLAIIFYNTYKHNDNRSLLHKLYKVLLVCTALMLFLDILGRMDGNPGTIYPALNYLGNFMLFLLSPVIPSIWLLFVHDYVFPKIKNRWLVYSLLAVNVIHMVLLVLSLYNEWFYYIDSDNIYHRGPLYLLSASFAIILLLAAYMLVVFCKNRINRKQYYSLLLFPLPPILCIGLQILFYGLPLILNSIVISLLIVYLNVQTHTMHTDYLTEVYNRKKLGLYLKHKIRSSKVNSRFSAIMIDINDFKSINDNYGHDMGDEALQAAAKLLRSCLRSDDFIARFGGDEFIVILDSADERYLESIVNRMHDCLIQHNATSDRPYKLGFSVGYTVYDGSSQMKVEDFIHQIDRLMYENKRACKENNEYKVIKLV